MRIDKKTGEVTYTPKEQHQMKLDQMRWDKHSDERRVASSNVNFLLYFLYLSFCLLLIVCLFRVASGMEPLTFTALLEGLNNCPSIMPNGFVNLTIDGDWGIFEFFRHFLNIFTGGLSILLFTGALLVQVVVFICYFTGWFFGFA